MGVAVAVAVGVVVWMSGWWGRLLFMITDAVCTA